MKRATKHCAECCAKKETQKGLTFPQIKISMPRISAKMPFLNLGAFDMLFEANLIPA